MVQSPVSINVAVVIRIGSGSFADGFSVTLQIFEDGKLIQEDRDLPRLPAAREFSERYEEWRSIYYALGQSQNFCSLELVPSQEFNHSMVDDFSSATEQLEAYLINWFAGQGFQALRDRISANVRVSADRSVPIIISCDTEDEKQDDLLRRLPWHIWDLFDQLGNAEIALSTCFTRAMPPLEKQIRVLAVLGSSVGGLQLERDRAVLEKLKSGGADIVSIEQPTSTQLNDLLFEHTWDILFFAGHSFSNPDCRSGRILIRDNEAIALERLRPALRRVIERGLKLAIFNSCDGLGLARFIERLSIQAQLRVPAIVVMREPVPDKVARDFFLFFLDQFSQGKPLCLAVREARARVHHICPAASWLPIVCQNPSQPELVFPHNRNLMSPIWIIAAEIVRNPRSPIWIIAAAIVLSLLGYRIWDFKTRFGSSLRSDYASLGEDILITENVWDEDYPAEKQCKASFAKKVAGRDAFRRALEDNNFDSAITQFRSYLDDCKLDAEAQIYLVNAQALQQTKGSVWDGIWAALWGDRTFRIAVSAPIRNEPGTSLEILQGVALQQQRINNFGIQGKLLQVQIVNDDAPDSRETSKNATVVAEKLTHDPAIKAVVGLYGSEIAALAAPVYNQGNLIVISPTSTAVKKSAPQSSVDSPNLGSFILRTAPTDAIAAQRMADHIRESGHTKVVIVYDSIDPYSRSLNQQFTKIFQEKGLSKVVHTCDLSQPTFKPKKCLDQAKDASALLWIPGVNVKQKAKEVIIVNADLPRPLEVWAGDAVYGGKMLGDLGNKANGMKVAIAWHHSVVPSSVFPQGAGYNWRTGTAFDALSAIATGFHQMGDSFNQVELRNYLLQDGFAADGFLGLDTVQFVNPDSKPIDGVGVGDRKPNKQLGVLVEVKCKPNTSECEYDKPD